MTANFRTLSLLSLAGLGACVTSAPVDSGAPTSGPLALSQEPVGPANAAIQGDWMAEVSARIQVGARAIVPNGAHLVVPMPHGLAVGTITDGGLQLQRRGGAGLTVRLDGLRRGEDAQALGEAAAQLGDCIPGQIDPTGDCVRAAERKLEGVTEWYIGLDSGVEQGFTFDERPLDGAGLLEIELAVDGALSLDTDGDTAWIADAEGQTWTVSDLAAWDANGEPLPVIFEAEGELLRVLVEDEGAAYPITVDPVYSTASTVLGSTSTFGEQVLGNGDFNGDGFDDVVVVDGDTSAATSSPWTLYFYAGAQSGIGTRASSSWSINTSRNCGHSISSGDFDGDGALDLAVGCPYPSSAYGLSYIIWGQAGAFPSSSSSYYVLYNGSAGDRFGTSLSMSGDINGDGFADLVIGAPGDDSNRGMARVIYGNSSRATSGSSVTRDLVGPSARGGFGWGVAIAGDVNATTGTFSDIVISAPTTTNGSVYVYHGALNGVSSSPNTTINGSSSSSRFAWSFAAVGDVNGDGYSDVAVSDSGYNSSMGRVYIYSGGSGGLSSTRRNVLSPTSSSTSAFGRTVAGIGDLDADGFDDLVVGQVRSNYGGFEIFHGDSSGPASNAADYFTNTFADCVAGGGDFNGDGYSDFVIGAAETGTVYNGRANVYYGLRDDDRDGVEASVDCDDNDANVGTAGTWYRDSDGDGHGASGSTSACTAPAGYVSTNDDCDDANAAAYPDATELVANGVDEDCDDEERCYRDRDADGAYDSGSTVASSDLDCTDPGESDGTGPIDCDDRDELRNPNATELPADGVDQDCDELELCYTDADADGFRSEGTIASADLACAEPGLAGTETVEGDCDDADGAVYPGAPERPGDEIDSDCDGFELCFVDQDGDGYVVSLTATVDSTDTDCADAGEASLAALVGDCDDTQASVNPMGTEIPGDGLDGDCDGQEQCYLDEDTDGYYGDRVVTSADLNCQDYGGLSLLPGDCNDAIFAVNPGVTEEPGDGIDQDCDGSDERVVDQGGDDSGAEDGSEDGPEKGCGGCSSSAPSPAAGLFGLLGTLGALFRRRR